MLVCKFGGSVLGGAKGFERARDVIKSDPDRRYIVVSAPGKLHAQDEKVTDLLYACQSAAAQGRGYSHIFDRIAARFYPLGIGDDELRDVFLSLKTASPAQAASCGEYLSARAMSRMTDFPFVDAKEVICFHENGALDGEKTQELIRARLAPLRNAVIPGFYGADAKGNIHTFPRGGSDVTAALIAASLGADACENFKDVRGVFAADPRYVPDARVIPDMTYAELETLSLLGADVLCREAVAPLRHAGVPLVIRSPEAPFHPGTWITPHRRGISMLTGVTGKTGLKMDRNALPHAALVAAVGYGAGRPEGMLRLANELCVQGIKTHALHQPYRRGYVCALIEEYDFPRAVRAAYDAFIR